MSELVIINGEEEFLKERAAISEACGKLSIHTLFYEYSDIDAYEEEVSTPTMFGESRAFVITGAKKVPSLPQGEGDILIVVSVKKAIEDKRAVRTLSFPSLKTYNDNNDVIKWAIKEGSSFGIDITPVATALFVSCGKSLRKIHSEIKKLSVITPQGKQVSASDFKSVACFSADLTPKDIIDPICDGNTLRALAFYDRLQKVGDETGWIIAYMQRHVIQFIKIEGLVRQKMSHKEISSTLGLHPFIFQKLYKGRIGLWTLEFLVQSLKNLCRLDIAHKTGNSSAKFCLESEIISLSEAAKASKSK